MSWWNPYQEPARELRTPLSVGECRERLRGRLAGWFAWAPSVTRPVKGRVTEAGFSIFRFELARHGFETEARGRFEADAAGTRIAVRFGLKWVDLVIIGMWFLFVCGVGLMFLLAGDPSGPGGGDDAFPRWFPGLMVAWLVILYPAFRWRSRGDAEFLARLIRETLGASEAQEQAPIE